MKFSIILATLNRSKVVAKAIESIINQSYREFEIIIIDQSDNNETKKISDVFMEKYNNIYYYKSSVKGLSKARNMGIGKAKGEFICLMDDDAQYQSDFLEKAYEIILENKYFVLSGLIKDRNTGMVFIPNMQKYNEEIINYDNIDLCCSASLIINKKLLVEKVGLFDELLGAGAYFGAAEESDLLFRILEEEVSIFYSSKLVVYHPYPNNNYSSEVQKRAYTYGLGEGALCKKMISNSRNKKYFIKRFIRNIIKTNGAIIIYYLEKGKRKFYINRLIGIMKGFREYKN